MSTTHQLQIPATFSYGTPAEVVFGNGTVATAGERAAAWGARKVLLIADKGVAEAGLPTRVEASLRSAGIAWETWCSPPGTGRARIGPPIGVSRRGLNGG